MNITEFRSKYPQYNDMSDEDLATSFHKKYYSDIPYSEFSKKFIGDKGESAYQKYTPEPIKNAVGGIESMGRMLWNVPAGAIGQAVGTYQGLLSGEGVDKSIKRGGDYAHAVSVDPFTKQGKVADEMLGDAFKYVVEGAADIASEDLKYDPNAPAGSIRANPKHEQKARSFYEGLLNAGAMYGPLKGVTRIPGDIKSGLDKRAKERDARDAAETAKIAEANKPPATENLAESLLREIDAELSKFPDSVAAPQYGLGRAKQQLPPDNAGRARAGVDDVAAVDRTTLSREQRMQQEMDALSRSPEMQDPSQVVNVRPSMERDPRSPQGELFPEPSPEPPRGQMDLPFDRDPRVLDMERRVSQGESMDYWNYQRMVEEQRASQERQAREQRTAQEPMPREVPSLEEGFKRAEYVKGLDERFTGPEPRTPEIDISRTEQRLLGLENQSRILEQKIDRALPPRGQRGAIFTEAISEGISTLWNKAINLDQKQQRVRETLKKLNQSDNQAVEAVIGEKRTPDEFYRTLPEGKVPDFDLLRTTPWQKMGLPAKVKQAIIKLPASLARDVAIFAADPGAVFKWTGNPLVKYVADTVRSIDAKWNAFSDVKKEGTRHVGEGFGSKKLVDPDSVSARREHLSTKEKNQVAELVNDLTAEPRALNKQELMAKGYGQKAIDLVEKMQKNLKDVLTEVNAALKKAGKDPIQDLPNYLMKYFGEGNFVTRIVDKDGKSLWFQRTKTKDEGRALAEQYLTKMKEKGIEGKIENPKFQSQSELADKMNLAPGVIKDIENALGRSDPRIKVLQQIQKELRNEVRAGGHAAKRKNVAGGEMDGKTVFKAYDRYIDQMSTYAKNVEIAAFQKELMEHPSAPPKGTVVRDWADHFMSSQRGENYAGGEFLGRAEKFMNEALGAHRIGGVRTATKYSSRGFNKAAMLILNPFFGFASWMQSTGFTISGINTYAALNGLSGSAGKAMTKAYFDMFSPSKDQRAFLNWEASRGSIDPTAVREWSSMNTRADKITNYALMEAIPKTGEKFGRIHSSIAAYEFLYENGFRGPKLWQEAERISRDYIMGDYSTIGRPALVRDSGFIGDAARPLSTFYNFYMNHVGVMMDLAIKGKPGPLVQHYLMNTMLAGLIGSPFIGAVNELWDALKGNKWFQEAARKEGFNINENTGTASEWILQNLPDAAVFGPIDAMFGRRMSGSLAAPEMHFPGETKWGNYGSAAFPGWAYAYKTIDSGIRLLADQVSPGMTRADQVKALKDFVPGKMADNLIENWDIIMGERDTTSVGKRGAGEFRRTPEEALANVIGGRTLMEERKKLADSQEFDREKAVGDDKTKVITLLADLVSGDKTQDPRFDRLVEKAINLGVDPKQLSKLIYNNLRDRELTKEERDVGKGRTSQQQRRLIDQLLMEEAAR